MPTFTKAYLGTTPLFKEQGFAFITGADAGAGVQSLANEFRHFTGTLTIFGNVTSTKDFHLCEGISAAPANCIITGTLTQTNAGPQGAGGSPRAFTVAQNGLNVGTLTIDGANISLFSGAFMGDNQSTGAVSAIVLNSGTFATNGGFWMAGPSNTFTQNDGTITMTNCYLSGGGNGTTNPNPVSVITINGGTFNINNAAAQSQSNIIVGVGTAGVSSTNTINLNGGTLKHNHITSNTPASGRTQTNTINFNGGTLDLDKGASRQLPLTVPITGVTWNFVVKSGGANISVFSGATMTFAVAFSDDGSNGGLTKIGTGTLALGSLNHSYNGTTSILAGTLTASKTSGSSTGTATFTNTTLSVSFNVAPTAGMTFRYFPGATTQTYASVTLVGAPGRTGTYNSANSTLTIA